MKIKLKNTTIAVLMAAGIFLAGAQTTPPAGSPVAKHGQLSVDGNQIVDKNGDAVQLRGMSLFWSMPPDGHNFYTKATVQHMRDDWQSNVIRAAMGIERNFWTDQKGYIDDPTPNKNRLTTVVDAAIELGMYVIIDWHSYAAELNQSRAEAFFKEMANKYGKEPNIIYEIYNEPNGIRAEGFTAAENHGTAIPSNRTTSWTTIRRYMQAVTDSIRTIDQNNLILIGTREWCQRPDEAAANPVRGTNLVYTAHFYAGDTLSAHRAHLRNRILTTMDRGFPVFVSEFGFTRADGAGTLDTDEGGRWLDFLDYHKIGWANWSLSTGGQTSGAIQSGNGSNPSGWQLSPSGTFIRNRLRTAPATTMPFRVLKINFKSEGNPTVNANHAAGVTVNGIMNLNAGTNSHTINTNATAVVEARPQNTVNWRFVRWEGDQTGTQNPVNVQMNNHKTLTAVFEWIGSQVSTLPGATPVQAIRWSVSRSGSGIVLSGPSSAEASLYNALGKRVGKFTYDGSGRAMTIGNRNMPAGHYMVVVRDVATGREVFRDRVMMVR